LLVLKKLGEVTKYSSSSSLLVVKLISVAVLAGFNCFLIALISSKRKAKDFFPGTALASK